MLHRSGFPLCISIPSSSPQISKSPIHSSRGQLVIFKSASIKRSNWFGCQLSISGKRAHPGERTRLRVSIWRENRRLLWNSC